jgi:sulfide dehydrogenase cytochrome subunit
VTARQALIVAAVLGGAAAPPLAAAAEPPPGATGCSGCHGVAKTATAIPPLYGRDAAELAQSMEAFRSGERPATVMTRIAKGFTPDEIRAITAWLAAQKDG